MWNLSKVNNNETTETSLASFFIAKFEKISHIVLVFPLYTLNMKMTAGAGKRMFNTEIYNYKQDEC